MSLQYKTASQCPSGCGSIVCHFHGHAPPPCDECRAARGRIGRPSPADCTCGTRGLHTADCPAREVPPQGAGHHGEDGSCKR